jgi:radical SAM protein with 4Fe4S-binding SPASM domain
MKGHPFSLILLATLGCNAECEYCFESKSDHHLTLDQLSTIVHKIMDHMALNHFETLSIYWQGGEVMMMPPIWFERAHGIIQEIAASRNLQVKNYIQSNMIAYSRKWNRVLAEMFGNSVGTSMDFPNLHRKIKGGSPQAYARIWSRNVREAKEAGIEVGVISIPNEQTLEMGAERFYSHFVKELEITDFQINTPFPGGAQNDVKTGFPMETHRLSRFLADLANVWMAQGLHQGVRIGPFNQLLDYFVDGKQSLLCIWRENCVNEFFCVDPQGHVAQCDCWVTGYPESWFGNIFDTCSLTDLLRNSKARRSLQARPGELILKEDCLDCVYLAICHGGCPVRAYTVHGDLFRKDPYCQLYKSLFQQMEMLAANFPGKIEDRSGSVNRPAASEVPLCVL